MTYDIVSEFWGKHLFLQFWIQLLNETPDLRFWFLEMVWIYAILIAVPAFFGYLVKFSKYDIFHKKIFFWGGVDFIFLVTLSNDINRISTNKMTVLE